MSDCAAVVSIRPICPADRPLIKQFLEQQWGADAMALHGQLVVPSELAGFSAANQSEIVGLITYIIANNECEIVSLNSLIPGIGIGSQLVAAVREAAAAMGCDRLWLLTTNDNLAALEFYQKRGFVLVSVHRNAVAAARKLKPTIPLIGYNGIPIRDEIELEMPLVRSTQ